MAKANKTVKEYMAEIGRKGGKSKSPKKRKAARLNGWKSTVSPR